MKKEKLLEQEYRKMKTQAAPDLWNRIEKGLKEHPERAADVQAEEKPAGSVRMPGKMAPFPLRRIYGTAAAAAAVVVLLTVSSGFLERNLGRSGSLLSGGDMAPAKTAAQQAETMQETTAGYAALSGGTALADADDSAPESEKVLADEAGAGTTGVIAYGQLQLAAYHPLTIPENAVTVEEDMAYFTEHALKDTMLLCQVTVLDARFGADEDGRTARIVYDVQVDERYYAAGEAAEVTGSGGSAITDAASVLPGMSLTVTSPIIGSGGDVQHSLYQLQPGGVYLLPLTVRDGGWEMVFPYAPQIQRTEDGQYLFHSGYYNLVGSGTAIVLGSQEGPNDYYYDRMFLREDDHFLSDLTALIEDQKAGEE